jgi:hypothetical protein
MIGDHQAIDRPAIYSVDRQTQLSEGLGAVAAEPIKPPKMLVHKRPLVPGSSCSPPIAAAVSAAS